MSKYHRSFATIKGKDTSRRAKPLVAEANKTSIVVFTKLLMLVNL